MPDTILGFGLSGFHCVGLKDCRNRNTYLKVLLDMTNMVKVKV